MLLLALSVGYLMASLTKNFKIIKRLIAEVYVCPMMNLEPIATNEIRLTAYTAIISMDDGYTALPAPLWGLHISVVSCAPVCPWGRHKAWGINPGKTLGYMPKILQLVHANLHNVKRSPLLLLA